MGYLQALQLMVRAYKAARGVMPKGLDLLKLKMRARQKAIDSNFSMVCKIILFIVDNQFIFIFIFIILNCIFN